MTFDELFFHYPTAAERGVTERISDEEFEYLKRGQNNDSDDD